MDFQGKLKASITKFKRTHKDEDTIFLLVGNETPWTEALEIVKKGWKGHYKPGVNLMVVPRHDFPVDEWALSVSPSAPIEDFGFKVEPVFSNLATRKPKTREEQRRYQDLLGLFGMSKASTNPTPVATYGSKSEFTKEELGVMKEMEGLLDRVLNARKKRERVIAEKHEKDISKAVKED